MSSSKNKTTKKRIQLPPNALQYCPDYIQFDSEVREDIKARFREHITSRRGKLIKCVDPSIHDIRDLKLRLQFSHPPIYNDNDDIINNAFNVIDNKINNWGGVQFSKKFLDDFATTSKQMDRKKFNTIANNHQDQTSWKVSGNKFFAPYIARAKQYLYDYCQCIVNVTETQRTEIFNFACISYAITLLTATCKFNRTKPKPLIRFKTLVKSDGIHTELELLYSKLKIKNWIACAKKRRKAADGKNTIKSEEFHGKLLGCCNTLYKNQKRKVYELFGISGENMSIDSRDDELKQDTNDIWPEDMADSNDENDNDSDSYKPYKVSSDDLNSSSSPATMDGSSNSNNSQRTFQAIDPHEYGIRNDMGNDLVNERRDYRENRRQQIRNNMNSMNNNIQCIDDDMLCEQLTIENNRLKMEKELILQQIRAMDRNQYNGIPVINYNYNAYPIQMPMIPQMQQMPQMPQLPPQLAPQLPSRMPSISNIQFEPNMILRQNSGGNSSIFSMDISGITSPITSNMPSFDDIDITNIPNLPQ